MLHIDHIFILVSPGAPEADALLEAGLIEGTANDHPGQGTSNRRFFLTSFTLEFLFIQNIAEAINGAGKGLQLVERAVDADASPFGLVARWKSEKPEPNFPHWQYQPDYFPKPMHFFVGENSSNFMEPLCICMPPALAVPANAPEPNNTIWSLTSIELSVPASSPSASLLAFSECDLVNIHYNQIHHLKLIFNNAITGNTENFGPEIPLTIEW